MGLARQIQRLRKKKEQKATRNRRLGVVLEPLEPRVLLSADLSFSSAGGAHVLDLRFDEGSEELRLYEGADLLDYEALDTSGVTNLNITGSSGDDQITIRFTDLDDLAAHESLAFNSLTITLSGGRGSNTLTLGDLSVADVDLSASVESALDLADVSLLNSLNEFVGGLADKSVSVSSLIEDFVTSNVSASISLTGATITAEDISLSAESSVSGTINGILGNDVDLDAIIPGFAAAIANVDSMSRVLIQGGSVTAAGDLTLSAVSNVTVNTTAATSSSGSDSTVDAAIALSVVDSTAEAKITGDTVLSVNGAIDVSAGNKVNVTTTADGAAGGSTAAGATVALSFVTTTTTASIDGNVSLGADTPDSIDLTAASLTDVTTRATSTTGGASQNGSGTQAQAGSADAGSGFSVVGALAVAEVDATNQAFLSSGNPIATSGALTIQADQDTDSSVTADGSRTGDAATGVGVAIAVNTPTVLNQAYLAGSVSAGSIQVGAGMLSSSSIPNMTDPDGKSVLAATATSGGGNASGVGAAGSFALNVVNVDSLAYIQEGASVTVTGHGDVSLTNVNNTESNVTAQPKDAGVTGGSLGLGGSFAINISDIDTVTELQNNVALIGANDLTLSATSVNNAITLAKTGAEATGSAGIGGAFAIAVVNNDTIAQLGGGNKLDLSNATGDTGDLSVTAEHTAQTTTTADGAASGASAGIGLSLALTTMADTVTATTARQIQTGGNAGFYATARTASTSDAKASAKGGKTNTNSGGSTVDGQVQGQRTAADNRAAARGAGTSGAAGSTPSASASDGSGGSGSVSVAGAVGVNIAKTTTSAYIPDLSGVSPDATVGGTLTLSAKTDADATARADGSATGTSTSEGVGVGVAVALNVADITNEAYVASNASVTAGGLTIEAIMPDTAAKHTFTADAKAGAGSSDIGIAGGVAINVVDLDSTAKIGAGAAVTITGGGDVNLSAGTASESTAIAQPTTTGGVSGGSLGIGASVALNIVDTTTQAEVGNDAVILNANDLSLSATSDNAAITTAKAGASASSTGSGGSGSSGGVGVGAAVAISVVTNETVAQLGTSSSTLALTGNLGATAAHTGITTTTADGEVSKGSSAAIGAAIAIGVSTDTTTATTLRPIDVDGDATFTATAVTDSDAIAKATAKGGATNSNANGSTVDSQAAGQRTFANNRAANSGTGARNSGTTPTPSASTSGGGVSVAAGIAINIATVDTKAAIPDGGNVTVGGDLSLSAGANSDAAADADGSATAMAGKTATFNPATSGVVDTSTETITVGTHSWRTGDTVVYSAGGGTAIGGLENGKSYYVITTGEANKIKLASSPQNASAGTAVDLTGTGAGTGHTLTGPDNSSGVGVGVAVALNVANVTNEASIGQSAVVSAGSLSISAGMAPRSGETSPTHTFGADATAGAGNADIGIAGSVAINIVDLDTIASVKPGAQVTLTGTGGANDASLSATAVTASNAIAQPTTTGGAGGGSLGIGASVALNIVDAETKAEIGGAILEEGTGHVLVQGATLAGANDLTLVAASENTVTTTAKAGASATSTGSSGSGGSGGVGVGAAVAISVVNNDTFAQVGSGGTLTLTGNLSATATHTGITRTTADGSVSQGSSAAIGAAISIGIATDNTIATTSRGLDVGGNLAFTAEAKTESTTVAKATARGGAPNTGSSSNGVDNQAAGQRNFANNQASNSGTGARNSSGASGTPSASTSSGGVTVAAGIAINIADVETRAYIPDGGSVTVDGSLSLSAAGKSDAIADADGSATGKSTSEGVGVGAAVALNVANISTEATIGANAAVTAGSLSLASSMLETPKPFAVSGVKVAGDAIEMGANNGLKTGDAVVYEKGAAGNGAVGGLQDGKTYFAIVDDTRSFNPILDVNPANNTIDIGENNLLQNGDKVVYTTGKAGNGGVGGLVNGTTYTVEVVDSSHIKLKDVTTGAVKTLSQSSLPSPTAILSDHKLTIVNPTRVKLAATAEDAFAGNAIDLTSAGTGTGHQLIDRSNHFRAEAAAGAGSADISVAGSVAINVVDVDATAAIGSGATVTVDATHGGTGNVSLTAESINTNGAIAEPTLAGGASGGSVGVGASIAVNVVNVATKAEVAGNVYDEGGVLASSAAILRNADGGDTDMNDVTLSAASLDTVITTARAGGAAGGGGGGSGGTGVGAGIAVAVVDNVTVASLGDSANAVSVRGDGLIRAEHTGAVVTNVGSKAAGSQAAVGASIGVNVVTDTTEATLGRSLTAGGGVTIRAAATEVNVMKVEASASGASESSGNADSQANSATSGNTGRALPTNASAGGNVNSANNTASNQSGQAGGGGSSGVGVAASIGVSVVTVKNEASIAANRSVIASGAVTVSAVNETDSMTEATGVSLSTNASNNIGAAVGVNVVTASNKALVGTNATLSGSGITVEALTPAGRTNDFSILGLAAGGGKGNSFAGSVGVGVVTFDTEASAGKSADLASTGNITFSAANDMTIQTVAGAAGIGKDAGVGAAVSVNVVTNTTRAFVDSGTAEGERSDIDASGDFMVQASTTINPRKLDLPLIDEADDPMITGVAISGGAGMNGAAVGGSLLVDVFTLETQAYVGAGAHINDTATGAGQDVLIQASDTTVIKGGAGGLGISGNSAGIGIGIDVGVITKDTRAYIGPSAEVHAAGDVTVQATSSEDILSIAVAGGIAAGSVGVGGAVSVQVVTTETRAYIGSEDGTQGSTVHAGGNMTISASGTFGIDMVGGGLGIGSSAGIGVGSGVLVHTDTVEARIGNSSNIEAGGGAGLTMTATSSEDVMAIAVAGGGAGTAGVGGSVTVVVLDETTRAAVGRDAWIDARNDSESVNPSVAISASDTTTIFDLAGSVAFGGTAGVGAGVDVAVVGKTTEAVIGKGTDVYADRNVTLSATSSEDILSIPVAGAVGGTVGVAGSFGVSVLTLNTRAYVEDGTSATDRAAITAGGSVGISASDKTEIDIFAGNIAGGGAVGVGVAAAVPVVTKTVEAYIGDWAKVDASAGGAGIQVKTGGFTESYAPNPVFSGNPTVSFALNGTDADTITRSSGSWTADGFREGQAIRIGGSADTDNDKNGDNDGTYVIERISADGRTLYLKGGENTRGLSRSESIAGSSLTIQMVADENGAIVASPASKTDMSGDGTSEFSNDESLTGRRTATADTRVLNGVGVSAVNQDTVRAYGFTGGAAGAVAVNVGGTVQVVTVTTTAKIGAQADVDTTSNAGSVLVAAGSDYQNIGVAAGISISGAVSVTPSVVVGVATLTTEAFIDDGADIDAAGDILVTAKASEDILVVAAGVAASGSVSVGGSIPVSVLTTTTRAFIGNDATSLSAGAKATAGGNILVSAQDDTDVDVIAGSLGVGIGVAGVGASVGVTVITKDTSAFIGDYATVDARGNTASTLGGLYTGEFTAGGEFATQSGFKGLAVQAASSEDILTLAVAGGGGFFAGIGGGINVTVLDSDTRAFIGGSAKVNTQAGTEGAAQSVSVTAVNSAKAIGVGGGLGIGIAGIGGGVDVGILRNDTAAYIGNGAEVQASKDVAVNALAKKDVDTWGLSVGGGFVGVAGSISVWAIGGGLQSSYTAEDDKGTDKTEDSLVTDGKSTISFADQQAGGTDPDNPSGQADNGYTSILNGFQSDGGRSGQEVAARTSSASTNIGNAAPVNPVSNSTAAPAPTVVPDGTVAFIGQNAVVTAGDDVIVRAEEQLSFDGITGNISGGVVAVGASILIATVDSNVEAYIDNNAVITAGGDAGDDILVQAKYTNDLAGAAYAGAAGAVTVGAQVVVLTDNVDVRAYVDSGADLIRAGNEVRVQAISDRAGNAEAAGGAVAGVAVGAAVAVVDVNGSTEAFLGSSVDVGTSFVVGSLVIRADAAVDGHAEAYAVQAGLGAVAVNVASVALDPTVTAQIGDSSRVRVARDVDVSANLEAMGLAEGWGVTVGAVGIGVMVADVSLGDGSDGGEVEARMGNSVNLQAAALRMEAHSTDSLLANSTAGSGGIVSVAGAQSNVTNENDTLVGMGNGSVVNVNTFYLLSVNDLEADARSEALSFGGVAGAGGGVKNSIKSRALVEIGSTNTVTAESILITAVNRLEKTQYANEKNLYAATASLVNVSVLLSETEVGTSTSKFGANVTLGSGTRLTALGDNDDPGLLQIETLTDVNATDKVQVDSVSVAGVSVGISRITTDTESKVTLDGAILENKSGSVYVTARSEADLKPSANLLAATALTGGAGAESTATINARNEIALTGAATIKATDIYLLAGRNAWGEVNLLDSFADSQIFAASLLPNISVPVATVTINETNNISVGGTSRVLALRDVNLITVEGLGGDERGTESGMVLSLSLIPYGAPIDDNPSVTSTNTVTIGTGALVQAGLNNKTFLHVKPTVLLNTDGNGVLDQLPANRLNTELTTAEKQALGIPADIKYHYAPLDLDAIPFGISQGTVVQAIAGANGGGDVNAYYEYLPQTDEQSDSIVLETENYANTSRWRKLTGTPTEEQTVYQSDLTVDLRTALNGKFYVIKPVELDAPTLSYQNVGNMLLEQRQQVLEWMTSHAGNKEALARYQVQLELIDQTLENLGLLYTVTNDNGQTAIQIKRELDTIFVNLPDVYAAPGSIFVEADDASKAGIDLAEAAGRAVASDGARIDILNQTPFSMTVGDAVIRDNAHTTLINGQLTVLSPGFVYFNNAKVVDGPADAADKFINIQQPPLGKVRYDLSGIPTELADLVGAFDQDIFIVGDVVNETGNVEVKNFEGSISVSGEIRGAEVTIYSARDFSLNTDDWLHTNRDPRQYMNLGTLRAQVWNQGGVSAIRQYTDATNVAGINLQAAINQNESRILAMGQVAVTARFLNINGLIQSGVDTITLHIDPSFETYNNLYNAGRSTPFLNDDGTRRQGISFGDEDIPVSGHFDAAKQAIVVDDIIPQGGSIILAGQILSTGNGRLKVAHGWAGVDIRNETSYDLILNRIDTSRQREGTITLIDTNRLTKTIYEFNDPDYDQGLLAANEVVSMRPGQVVQNDSDRLYRFKGSAQNINVDAENYGDTARWEYLPEPITQMNYTGTYVPASGGAISRIDYTQNGPTQYHDESAAISYATEEGLHYVWTEGQEKTKVTVRKFEKNQFNLFGEDNWLADILVADDSYQWETVTFRDATPLLESESRAEVSPDSADDAKAPPAAAGTVYSISYQQVNDQDVNLIPGATLVRDVQTGMIYRYKSTAPNNVEAILNTINFATDSNWEYTGSTAGEGWEDTDLKQYDSDYLNYATEIETWTTGGGWLRKKTYHTKLTITEGLKDFYTHSLKADYPVAVDFDSGSPYIEVYTTHDMLLQGDIKGPDYDLGIGSRIWLTSTAGSILGSDDVAVYGTTPTMEAYWEIRVNVEGDKGPLQASAGGDIRISAVSLDNQSSRLEIADGWNSNQDPFVAHNAYKAHVGVESTGGDVFLNAQHGIRAESSGSLVTGDRIELRSDGGAIGSSGLPLRINSSDNALELGGIAARANGSIHLTETAGNMKLIGPESWNGSTSIESVSGDVNLSVTNGSVLDVNHELTKLQVDPAQAHGVQNPLSPGLMRFLYPHTEFLGISPDAPSGENANIDGANVTIYAGVNGQVGNVTAPAVINFSSTGLAPADQAMLSSATAEDVRGVSYEIYKYKGSALSNVDLTHVQVTHDVTLVKALIEVPAGATTAKVFKVFKYVGLSGERVSLRDVDYLNDGKWVETADDPSTFTQDIGESRFLYTYLNQGQFADTNLWEKVTPNWVTGTSRAAAQNVGITTDQTVRVQYSASEYGLYKYKGASGSINLGAQDFANMARWEKLTPTVGTDSGEINLANGQLVNNQFVIDSLVLQIWDDVNVEASGAVDISAGGGVAVESDGSLALARVIAGADVRLLAVGGLTDLHADGTASAIATPGDLVLGASRVEGADGTSGLRTQLGTASQLSADVVGEIDIDQMATDSSVRHSFTVSDLDVLRVNAGGPVKIEVAQGDMNVGRVASATSVDLRANHDIQDLFDDSSAPIVDVFTNTGTTGDVYLQAGNDIGMWDNFTDVEITDGALTVQAGRHVFVHSVDDLNVADVTSTSGNVTLDVDGDANVDQITAWSGTVRIDAEGAILDWRNETAREIDGLKALLNAGAGLGTATDALETSVSYLESETGTGIWLDNTGNLRIGGVSSQVGIVAANTVDISAFSSITVDEAIDSGAGPVLLDASTDITTNAAVTSGGGRVVFAAARDILTNALVDSEGGSVRFAADRDITINGPARSGGGLIDLLADDDIFFTPAGSVDNETGGATITMTADADYSGAGGIDMNNGSYVDATNGLIDVDATQNIRLSLLRTTTAVTVDTTAGAILDTADSLGSDIEAATAVLHARTGIGVGNPMETVLDRLEGDAGAGGMWLDNSGNLQIGDISATVGLRADGDIAVSTTGRFTVREHVISRNEGGLGNDVTLTAHDAAAAGRDLIVTNNVTVEGDNVTLRAGDNLRADAGTTLHADRALNIRGDHANADPGLGTRIDLDGHIASTDAYIYGETDDDIVDLHLQSIEGHTRVYGNTGEDLILVDHLPNLDVVRRGLASRDSLDIDGQGDTDDVIVNATSNRTDYIINVWDTGVPDNGADTLTINGTEPGDPNNASGEDLFLLREKFVAYLNPDSGPTDLNPEIERINYNENINGRLVVNGLGGADAFYSDDNSAITTIDGGSGDDFFQFGQVFGLDRQSPQVSTGDEIETVETTLGFLSRGNSFATTVYGGDGEDKFSVYSNKALLKLFGEDGNDEFVVRAFAIKNSAELASTDSEVHGGGGDDLIQYNINAPVNIDGGAGVDTIVVLGTELDDNFVITEDGVMGAGLNIDFTAVEKLEVDGLEGDDHFFILSTNPDMVTTIIGGLGSDTFDVGGDVTGTIVAMEVEGRSGIINHSVTSEDPAYNGIFTEGIRLNVADAQTGTVMVENAAGKSVVEGGDPDSYTIRLAPPAPIDNLSKVYMTVSAAQSPYKDQLMGAKALEVSVDGTAWLPALVLTFDPTQTAGSTAWDRLQTIYVRGTEDAAAEGERIVVISHSTFSDNKDFNHLAIPNVEVKVIDNDKAGLIIKETDLGTQVLEGDSAGDTYSISLTKAPNAGETVTVRLDLDSIGSGQVVIESADSAQASRFDSTTRTITFDSTNWNTAFQVKLTAVDDTQIENRLRATITHNVMSTGGEFDGVLEKPEIKVGIRDNDAAGLIVTQTNGSTLVSEGNPDTYAIVLTKAPTAPVTVSILTDGQTIAGAYDTLDTRFGIVGGTPTVTFDANNWNDPFTVKVTVNPDAAQNEGSHPIQTFPAQPHSTADIRGPLIIEGSVIPGRDRSLTPAVMLPTETDGPLPMLSIEVDETRQTDTLNVFNDGSVSNDVGVLRSPVEMGGLKAVYEDDSIVSTEFGNISGLNMGGEFSLDFGTQEEEDVRLFDGGVTYHGVEVVDILLGQGNDSFTVEHTVKDTITVVQGGGNGAVPIVTSEGDILGDYLKVTGGGGPDSPLIILGDTTQDGRFYDSTTANITGRGRAFTIHGDDLIDARGASGSVAIYGGRGNDKIYGSQQGDQIAGGSGDDEIHGQGGSDHIYGDSGFNLNLTKRLSLAIEDINHDVLNFATAPGANDDADTRDGLAGGQDRIFGEGGNEVIFGDHGVIRQTYGTERLVERGNIEKISSAEHGNGAHDEITTLSGNDIVFGGNEGDWIHVGDGNNVVFGDEGFIDYVLDGNLADIDLAASTSTTAFGGVDTITSGAGSDLIVGGRYGDTISAGDGNNLVIGDSGKITAA
ncbi:MAG: calcium-binding protein, partial [Desulfobacteraceae bacterium]